MEEKYISSIQPKLLICQSLLGCNNPKHKEVLALNKIQRICSDEQFVQHLEDLDIDFPFYYLKNCQNMLLNNFDSCINLKRLSILGSKDFWRGNGESVLRILKACSQSVISLSIRIQHGFEEEDPQIITELKEIGISNEYWIQLSQFQNLRDIQLQMNHLKKQDGFEILHSLKQLQNLQSIELNMQLKNDKDIEMDIEITNLLLEIMSNSEKSMNTLKLKLDYKDINDEVIFNGIKKLNNLMSLDYSFFNPVSSTMPSLLSNTLSTMPDLHTLKLEFLYFGSSLEILHKLFLSNIYKLSLSFRNLHKNYAPLIKFLQNNKIEELSLDVSHTYGLISNEVLSEQIQQINSIKKVEIFFDFPNKFNRNIYDQQIISFALFPNLQFLTIKKYTETLFFGDEFVIYLSEALKQSPSLLSIKLDFIVILYNIDRANILSNSILTCKNLRYLQTTNIISSSQIVSQFFKSLKHLACLDKCSVPAYFE